MDDNLLRKTETKRTNYIYTFVSMIPVVSSAVCAVYVILMYSNVKLLIKDFGTINNIINNINSTKMEGLIDGIISLEKCVLTKLPICS
jgi:hypothetical protein